MIDRRATLLGIGATVVAPRARAQASRPLLAVLSPARRDAPVVAAVNRTFKDALAGLGWQAGRNIDMAERFAEGDAARLPALAAELVAMRPAVLFTNTSHAAVVAAAATRTVPIVVGPAGEYVLTELAGGSIARPTTNVTGFVLTSPHIDDKVISLLMEAVPATARIGVLVNPHNPGQRNYPAVLKGSSAAVGKELVRLEATGPQDLEAALSKAATERVEALFVADDAHLAGDPQVRRHVLDFAARARMPVASSHQRFALDGALVAMGPSIPVLAASAAGYVDKILKGASPRDLPVQLPTVFHVLVNAKAAKALGLTIPAAILLRADEVIE